MTHFAPADRTSDTRIFEEAALLRTAPELDNLLNAMAGAAAILDGNRQIVYANRDFLKILGDVAHDTVLGFRVGESIGCIHSGKTEGGCGTANACRYCGAIQAVMECKQCMHRVDKEARVAIETPEGRINLDLMVTATPYRMEEHDFILITLRDIGDTKRRQVMERLFFHDILNSVSGIHGALELLNEFSDKNEGKDLIGQSLYSSSNLKDEIQTFRMVIRAETGDLVILKELVNGSDILAGAADIIRYHEIFRNKQLELDSDNDSLLLETDPAILSRILVNMIKNALEATHDGGTVRVGIHRTSERKGRFRVWNKSVMSQEVREQIFQKSFSTKGKDRGLGTWSILLLGEQYLNGKVDFSSEEGKGTEFSLTLDLAKESK